MSTATSSHGRLASTGCKAAGFISGRRPCDLAFHTNPACSAVQRLGPSRPNRPHLPVRPMFCHCLGGLPPHGQCARKLASGIWGPQLLVSLIPWRFELATNHGVLQSLVALEWVNQPLSGGEGRGIHFQALCNLQQHWVLPLSLCNLTSGVHKSIKLMGFLERASAF